MNLNGRVDKLLQEAAALITAAAANPRRILYATEEVKRRGFVETLAADCPRVFGADDPRAERAYLDALTLPELHTVFRDMMEAEIAAARANPTPDMIAFRQLDVAAKIEVLYKHRRFDAQRGIWR
jgi:hypothetical protein